MLACEFTCASDDFTRDPSWKVDLSEVALTELYNGVVAFFGEEPFAFLTGEGGASLNVTDL
jgi:hypothetical protein